MATYTVDFSGGTIGAAPSGWTLRQSATPAYTLENVEGAAWGTAGQTLKCVMSGDAHHLYCLDALDTVSADMELLTLCRASSKSDGAGCSLGTRYANPSGTNWVGYMARRRANTLQIVEKTGATESVHTTRETGLHADQWAWIRLRVNGTSIKVKIWAAWEAEPTLWLSEVTDASTAAAGWSGLMGYDSLTDPYYFAWFSAGSGGDTAPMPAYSTSEMRLSSLFVEYLIRNGTLPPAPPMPDYVAVCVN